MANRLRQEKSPYLLQHGDNPVDWYPWCQEAFRRARQEDKPVFLSIGYSTCHWCHVMARESFADEEVADALNRDFISIKVDREERPDVDAVYMEACQAFTGSGGWPTTLFLTATWGCWSCWSGRRGCGRETARAFWRPATGWRSCSAGKRPPRKGSRTGPCCTGPTASSGSGSTRCGAVLDAPPNFPRPTICCFFCGMLKRKGRRRL